MLSNKSKWFVPTHQDYYHLGGCGPEDVSRSVQKSWALKNIYCFHTHYPLFVLSTATVVYLIGMADTDPSAKSKGTDNQALDVNNGMYIAQP